LHRAHKMICEPTIHLVYWLL